MKRLMYVLFFVLLTSGMAYAQQAKYVFYFIGDGMGGREGSRHAGNRERSEQQRLYTDAPFLFGQIHLRTVHLAGNEGIPGRKDGFLEGTAGELGAGEDAA